METLITCVAYPESGDQPFPITVSVVYGHCPSFTQLVDEKYRHLFPDERVPVNAKCELDLDIVPLYYWRHFLNSRITRLSKIHKISLGIYTVFSPSLSEKSVINSLVYGDVECLILALEEKLVDKKNAKSFYTTALRGTTYCTDELKSETIVTEELEVGRKLIESNLNALKFYIEEKIRIIDDEALVNLSKQTEDFEYDFSKPPASKRKINKLHVVLVGKMQILFHGLEFEKDQRVAYYKFLGKMLDVKIGDQPDANLSVSGCFETHLDEFVRVCKEEYRKQQDSKDEAAEVRDFERKKLKSRKKDA